MTGLVESDAAVFDNMAEGWYNVRHWTIFKSELKELAEKWQKGRLLNLGCGHGADFMPFKDKFELVGVDFSASMLEMARKYAQKYSFPVQLEMADLRHLPFPDSTFDCAVAVASLHHLAGHDQHLAAVLELKRVLKPGVEAFVTVWNRGQARFWFTGSETLVPWQSPAGQVFRYYYLFTYREIENLMREAGFMVMRSRPEQRYTFPLKYFSHNICLLIKKPG